MGKGSGLKAAYTRAKEDLMPEISYIDGMPYYDENFLLGFEGIGTPNSENHDFLIKMPGYEKTTLWCNASGHSMEPEINWGHNYTSTH